MATKKETGATGQAAAWQPAAHATAVQRPLKTLHNFGLSTLVGVQHGEKLAALIGDVHCLLTSGLAVMDQIALDAGRDGCPDVAPELVFAALYLLRQAAAVSEALHDYPLHAPEVSA